MDRNEKIDNEHRNGAVKDKTQVYNPVTGNYVKRDSSSGRFIDIKSDGKAFKDVKKESQITKAAISVSKSIAKKAEQSVIKTINRKAN